MPGGDKCVRRRLAERGTFHVEMCDCGVIQMTIGCLTLRLDPRAYSELAEAVHESLSKLQTGIRPLFTRIDEGKI
jgi:hypothetical protein